MTVPVLRALTKQHPKLTITVVSKAFLKPLFNDLPNVNFYTADVKGTHKGILGIFKLYRELQKKKITHIADLHNVLRSKILRFFFRFSNKKIATIDKGRTEKKALTRTDNKVFKQLKTSHQRYADVFDKLGFKIDLYTPTEIEKPNTTTTVAKLLKGSSAHKIGFAPFAAYNSKMYPIELSKVVIQELAKTTTVYLFGGGTKEIEILTKIEHNTPNCISVAGKVTFAEELNIMAQLDCMIAMDSGNAHLAAMQQVPTITLWGTTHPYAGFAPFNQPKENCLLPDLKKYPKIPTSIYGNKIIDGYEDVMKTILPENVIKKVQSVLKLNS
ncbi:MAG: glycosyltransferase family 9 protein [Flavobacteriaceae bacterium]|nr:glycosyltransferase family 9 protein [Flavobacteriaceae bacterium]